MYDVERLREHGAEIAYFMSSSTLKSLVDPKTMDAWKGNLVLLAIAFQRTISPGTSANLPEIRSCGVDFLGHFTPFFLVRFPHRLRTRQGKNALLGLGLQSVNELELETFLKYGRPVPGETIVSPQNYHGTVKFITAYMGTLCIAQTACSDVWSANTWWLGKPIAK